MSKNVLIRADGSKEIGIGHISRAVLLSNMLKKRFGLNTKLIMKENRAVRDFLVNRNIDVLTIKDEVTFREEMVVLDKICMKEKPLLFVFDVLEYDTDPLYLNSARGTDCAVLAITDDSNKRIIEADVIINGNPGQLSVDYSLESGKYLCGPKYFIMDPAYEDIAGKCPTGGVNKILLTMGCSDHNDLIFRLLGVFERSGMDISLMVIASSSSGYVDRLMEYMHDMKISNELFVDVENLVPFWQGCDLAITAGGNTLFERIAALLPGATICQLERQMEIADSFEGLGVNVNLGLGLEISDEILDEKIKRFINNGQLHMEQNEKAHYVVDGKGLMRFGDEVQSLLEGCCYEL